MPAYPNPRQHKSGEGLVGMCQERRVFTDPLAPTHKWGSVTMASIAAHRLEMQGGCSADPGWGMDSISPTHPDVTVTWAPTLGVTFTLIEYPAMT